MAVSLEDLLKGKDTEKDGDEETLDTGKKAALKVLFPGVDPEDAWEAFQTLSEMC